MQLLSAIVSLLRPTHWVKNLFVLAPLLFSGNALNRVAFDAALTFAAFCLAASFAYAINDCLDAAEDRYHPDKRLRPVASGALSRRVALGVGLTCGGAAVALATSVSWRVTAWISAYLLLNIAYSKWLKHVVLVDLFAIAGFFLLRLLAGAAAIEVHPTIWMLLCGGLLALYLVVSKRQQEIGTVAADAAPRALLLEYSPALLEQIAVILIAATFLSYCQYVLLSETAQNAGNRLAYGAPFVLYGLLRYQLLVHRRGRGNPMDTLFADKALAINFGLWVGINA